jgi:tetratricopeptide (TPR) repeat protein
MTGKLGRTLRLLFSVALAVTATACATLQRPAWPPVVETLPQRSEVAGVPFFAQEEYQCGPAAMAMALGRSGLRVTPEDLTGKVYTASLRGSLQPAMIAAARRLGRLAYVISTPEALLREIAAGHPVVVLQNLGLDWVPVWHYAVAIGYDILEGEVILHSGRDERLRTDWRVFENTWSRADNWGLLVLRPEEMPATARETTYVEAVVGLERAGSLEAAARGYETALSRWPENLTALMGLGNSRYALGDIIAAESAFRLAAEAHPQSGAAWNNLADVLLRLGRKDEALAAVNRALELGGPDAGTYRQTLEEIRAAP